MQHQKQYNKKAQEEIVGFVVIVVLVTVALVIFLGIIIGGNNSGSADNQDAQINSFLQAITSYTTNCTQGQSYLSLGSALESCYANSGLVCNDGVDVCDEVGNDTKSLIESAWFISPSSPTVGYIYNSSYEVNSSASVSQIEYIVNGTCGNNYKGSYYDIGYNDGTIDNTLKICY